jgi:hypothetical protein
MTAIAMVSADIQGEDPSIGHHEEPATAHNAVDDGDDWHQGMSDGDFARPIPLHYLQRIRL